MLAPTLVPTLAAAQSPLDRAMARLAAASPIGRTAREEVAHAIARLRDPETRRQTRAALFDPEDCILSRAGLDAARQDRIIRGLQARGWIDAGLQLATVRAALFPALPGDGGPCPHLGIPALAAPGGNTGSHHSWPGGLAVHIAVNLRSAGGLADSYSAIEGVTPDRDRIDGAILWHDWAKALVLRWRSDGTTTDELAVAGAGAHHVLGLAEAMRRGFAPEQIVAQACAHGPATGDGQARVQAWLDAAAVIAQVDGRAYRATPTPACFLAHLADQNWIYSDEAVIRTEAWLKARSPALGIDPSAEPARFRLCLLVPALAWLGAERVFEALVEPDRVTALLRQALTASASSALCPAHKTGRTRLIGRE
ncbi:hypothetical protein E5A73_18930 [Sphingomonas gei]|uniref:Uncharacterized protein n=2 Tax=Sphingomonas gei TaxID=1395960 RepID=A0A4V3QYA3_9SPHN|nr:hypothetical protein E5A73_18930 [Sphingomonas gei]